MKRKIFLALLFMMNIVCAAEPNSSRDIQVDRNGRILVGGERVYVTRQYDGKRVALREEHIVASAGKNPGLFLSIYWDADPTTLNSGAEHIIITDATGEIVRQSNVLDTGIDFQWDDNNYVIFEGHTMYFGIYKRNCIENDCRTMTVPHRMQFIYRDGKLEENKGPWRGPAKPEIYIAPQGTDPCFNVNSVEACREELERDKAARRAKNKPKGTPAAIAK